MLRKKNGKLVKSFTNFTEKEGLANNAVLSILQDVDGNIWFGGFGSMHGVYSYDGTTIEVF